MATHHGLLESKAQVYTTKEVRTSRSGPAPARERRTHFHNYRNLHTNTADNSSVEHSTRKTLHLAGKSAHISITTKPTQTLPTSRSVEHCARKPCTSRESRTPFHDYRKPSHKHCRQQKCGTEHQKDPALSREKV